MKAMAEAVIEDLEGYVYIWTNQSDIMSKELTQHTVISIPLVYTQRYDGEHTIVDWALKVLDGQGVSCGLDLLMD